jgi:uncharacterized protein (DUF1330 family)
MSALFLAVGRITDQDKLNQYLASAGATLAAYECQITAFTTEAQIVEGEPPGTRVVVLTFPDKETAMKWYNSDDYQAIVNLRLESTEGFALLCDAT